MSVSFIPISSLCRFGAVLGVAWTATGCVGVCPGTRPSCESSYPAARLALHEGGRWFGPTAVWGGADGQLRGDLGDGSRWSVAALGDRVAIGHPEARRVTLAPAPDGEAFLADAASGSWSDPGLGFGTAVAAARPTPDEPFDLWVGAPGAATWRGEVLWWSDAEAGLGEAPTLRIVGSNLGDELGGDVLACGDVTGDGRADGLASVGGFSGGDGQVAPLLSGAVALIRSDEADARTGEVALGLVASVWWGEASGDGAGEGLACGRDLTGDGRPDVVVGAPWAQDDAGEVTVVSASASDRDGGLIDVGHLRLRGAAADDWFGAAIALGDFDGDGLTDLAVGAPGARGGVGTVFVYDGRDLRDAVRAPVPTTIIELEEAFGTVHFGTTLAAARIGPDAIDDLVVGVPEWTVDGEAFGVGRAFVFDGGTWPSTVVAVADATRVVEGAQAFQRVGRTIALADVDGDGTSDLLLPTGDRAPR